MCICHRQRVMIRCDLHSNRDVTARYKHNLVEQLYGGVRCVRHIITIHSDMCMNTLNKSMN